MVSKVFFVFGLLSLFACQAATAVTNQEFKRSVQNETVNLSLGELIKQFQEVNTNLQNLESGEIGDALKTLANLASTISELKQHSLDQGNDIINDGIGKVVDFINNKTQEASERGVDIGECVAGRNEQLQQLRSGLDASLTDCVTTKVDGVLTQVNNDTETIKQIVGNINNLPVKLSKCLISLRPITCVKDLLKSARDMESNLPGRINRIVNKAIKLVDGLPTKLNRCVSNIASSTASKTNAMISEIGTCVDNIIAGN